NQFTAALSTLEAAEKMHDDILSYQHNFFKNARTEGQKTSGKNIVFGDEKDAAKAYELDEILRRHQIEIYQLKKDITLNGKDYKRAYSYVVPQNQKNSRLIAAMFEKRTKFQDSLFYDISAWTLPLAFNLDYAEAVANTNLGDRITNL